MAYKYFFYALAVLAAGQAQAASLKQVNLTSDGAVTAAVIDTNLKNPWGVAFSPAGPFWVSDNGTGLTTLYGGTGQVIPLVVAIPAAAGGTGPGSPTGQVFNPSSTDFQITAGGVTGAASFLFATEDGTISGWNFGVDKLNAVVAVDLSSKGASFKGLAYYTAASGANYVLAADLQGGVVDVFDGSFNLVSSFRDKGLSARYSPFNVAVLGGDIYVTYGLLNSTGTDVAASSGFGVVEKIDATGAVLDATIGGRLNAPWGLAIAPAGFGRYAGALLVGNFGDGRINVYDKKLHFKGPLTGAGGAPITIPGLWALTPGNGGSAGSASNIYFTAGVNNEADGLLGSLTYSK